MTVLINTTFDVIVYVRSSGKTALKPKVPKGLGLTAPYSITCQSTIHSTCGEKRFCVPVFVRERAFPTIHVGTKKYFCIFLGHAASHSKGLLSTLRRDSDSLQSQ